MKNPIGLSSESANTAEFEAHAALHVHVVLQVVFHYAQILFQEYVHPLSMFKVYSIMWSRL